MAGSLVLLPVIFLFYSEQGSTNLLSLTTAELTFSRADNNGVGVGGNEISGSRQLLLGWGMLIVFAAKIP
jgi:hypothetical protein